MTACYLLIAWSWFFGFSVQWSKNTYGERFSKGRIFGYYEDRQSKWHTIREWNLYKNWRLVQDAAEMA